MNPRYLTLAAAALLLAPSAKSAEKSYDVGARMPYFDDGRERYRTRRVPTGFRLEVLGDSDGTKPEESRNGRPFVNARPGERYSVRLYNPLPVRVAVNLTVDGLNSITGKPSGISDGQKWLVEPYSYVTISGWQVNAGESRRFFFTDKRGSYAKWRGDWTGKDLAANCGVIGAAFFWNQQELDRYYAAPPRVLQPEPWYQPVPGPSAGPSSPGYWEKNERQRRADDDLSDVKLKRQEAGTGMGERESHPTQLVDFRYDTGMYRADQALLVYYDFGRPEPQPNAFPNLSFAPEMP
ncbi:MAG: hypothetical protein HY059_18775 [Proteobacteria bacterium]|nr:hypothetical protein [Pseudomonadota bacterium]